MIPKLYCTLQEQSTCPTNASSLPPFSHAFSLESLCTGGKPFIEPQKSQTTVPTDAMSPISVPSALSSELGEGLPKVAQLVADPGLY